MQIFGAAVTVLSLYAIFRKVNLTETLIAFKQFHWPYLMLIIGSLGFGYTIRIFRWSIMLSATGETASWATCAPPFLGSIALNNILPLRLGDVIRAFVFPASMGISKTTATGSLLMERLIDLITLLGCLAIGLALNITATLPTFLTHLAIGLAVSSSGFLIFGFLFSKELSESMLRLAHHATKKKQRLFHFFMFISQLLESIQAISKPRVLFIILSLSSLVWIGETGSFYFLLLGFGFTAHLALALIVMAVATLSTLIPSSPGYFGPFHLAAFMVISLVGGSPAQASSFAILSHLALWLPTTLVGLLFILMNPALFRMLPSKENLNLQQVEYTV